MNTRNTLGVEVLKITIASSVTSTAGSTAVDLANYFPVGKREIKFAVGMLLGTTSTGIAANVTIQECESTATASFTNVLAYDGSTLTATLPSTDATHEILALNGMVNYRYIRATYNAAQATTGNTISLFVLAFPHVRAA